MSSWFSGKPKINKEELQTRIAVLEQRVDKLEGVPQTAAPLALRAPTPAVAAPPVAVQAPLAVQAAVPQEQFSRLNSRSISDFNSAIAGLLGEKYSADVERRIPVSKNTYPCGEFTLECLVASGQNLNCFLNSFFTVTCPAFRAALGKQSSFFSKKMTTDQFSERYRRDYLPSIITSVAKDPTYMRRDATREGILAGDKKNANRNGTPLKKRTEAELDKLVRDAANSVDRSQKVIARDIAPPRAGEPRRDLSDDLIAFLCHYYTIQIVLFGKPDLNGTPFARGIGTTGPIYAISNPDVGHFEPCRVKGENRYILTPGELESITAFYGGVGDQADQNLKVFEQQFNGINVPREKWKNTNVIGPITEQYRLYIDDPTNTIVRLENLQNEIKAYKRRTAGKGRSDELDILAREIRKSQASAFKDPDPETDTLITQALEQKVRAITDVAQVAAPARVAPPPVVAQRSSAWAPAPKGSPRAPALLPPPLPKGSPRAPALLPPPLPKGSPRAPAPPEPQWEQYGDDQKYIAALTAFYKQYPQAAPQKKGGRRKTQRRVLRKKKRYTRK